MTLLEVLNSLADLRHSQLMQHTAFCRTCQEAHYTSEMCGEGQAAYVVSRATTEKYISTREQKLSDSSK